MNGRRPAQPREGLAAAPPRRPPSPRPRDAATLILLDRSGPVPKVLMGRRHHGHAFMPGRFVFPGGRVEPGDARMAALGALDASAEAALRRRARPRAQLARALALAAIRETFEETGLLLGLRGGEAPPSPGGTWAAGTWAAFRQHGVTPRLDPLHFVARAITPPGRPRRFDTRFFAADRGLIAHEVAGVVREDTELVELVWAPLDGLGRLDLHPITLSVLEELRLRLEAGLRADLPVPFFHEQHGRRRRDLL